MNQVLLIALTFLAGILLGIRLVAALYAPIDLWYTIRTAWPVAVRRVVGWSAATTAALLLLPVGSLRWALVAGMGLYLIVHLAMWFVAFRLFPETPESSPVVE